MESRARRTQEGVLDERTRLILFKMINKGTLFREVGGVVKTGKESYVFYAPGVGGGGVRGYGRREGGKEGGREEEERDGERDGEEETESVSGVSLTSCSSASSSFFSSAREGGREGGREGCDCAIKVFKTTLNEFSNRALYIDGDPRFGKMLFNKVQEGEREGRREEREGDREEGGIGALKCPLESRHTHTKTTLLTSLPPYLLPSLPPLPPPAILPRQIPTLGGKGSP